MPNEFSKTLNFRLQTCAQSYPNISYRIRIVDANLTALKGNYELSQIVIIKLQWNSNFQKYSNFFLFGIITQLIITHIKVVHHFIKLGVINSTTLINF